MALTDKQLEVVNHRNGNILVSASAGSGKTHTIITRIISLILNGDVNVNDISLLVNNVVSVDCF